MDASPSVPDAYNVFTPEENNASLERKRRKASAIAAGESTRKPLAFLRASLAQTTPGDVCIRPSERMPETIMTMSEFSFLYQCQKRRRNPRKARKRAAAES